MREPSAKAVPPSGNGETPCILWEQIFVGAKMRSHFKTPMVYLFQTVFSCSDIKESNSLADFL